MMRFWVRLKTGVQGQDLVEYALAAGLVAVAAVAALPGLTSVLSNVFAKTASIISNSVS